MTTAADRLRTNAQRQRDRIPNVHENTARIIEQLAADLEAGADALDQIANNQEGK